MPGETGLDVERFFRGLLLRFDAAPKLTGPAQLWRVRTQTHEQAHNHAVKQQRR